MSGSPHRTSAGVPAGTTASPPLIALDTHVHLYPGADPGRALSAGRDNLAMAALAAGRPADGAALLLTETVRDDAFGALADGRLVAEGWQVRPAPEDRAALRARRHADGAVLLLVAGRQIVTEEGIEVLALATAERFSDGQPVRAVLAELRARGIPAVLPWGVGKWIGARGRTVAALLAEAGRPGLMLGDNAGRPRGWTRPALFARAAAAGIAVLPGSDPLPLRGAEAGIGRFGCVIEGALDPDRPAADLRNRLFALRGQPAAIGRRRGPLAVLAEQVALRRRKTAPAGRGGAR